MDGWLQDRRPRTAATTAAGSSITGRSKEIIVLSSGKNIYPEEIEAVYRKSAVHQGNLRAGPGAARRAVGRAAVRRGGARRGLLRERKVANIGDLLRFEMEGASVHLPHHKRVLGYEIWREPLPRTSTGKIRRFEIERRVRAEAQARQAPGGPDIVGCRSGVAGATRPCADPRRDGQGAASRGWC